MAAVNYAKMQSKAWYGDERVTLRFPEGWEVNTVACEPCAQYGKYYGNFQEL